MLIWLWGMLFAALAIAADTPPLPPAAKIQTDFSRDIEPIFARKCIACHGAAQAMNGLRLDNPEAALKGGYSGPAIVAGASADSKLIHRVASTKKDFAMPPAGAPLTAAEVGILRAWIDQGARWSATAKRAQSPKSNHWAFQPVRKAEPPAVRNRDWARNPIDRFVLARLEQEGLTPSGEADRTTLLRRVKLDLTGLPPTRAEISEFVSDNRPDAYERLVNRLLTSPHYGERWARHWLDLARYADSDGYEKDQVRPFAWRYRQWVIDALNRDLPFDQFTIEQMAGDLLPGATREQRVATGFHRNTLTNREAGVSRAEARFEQLVNRASTVGGVWLGVTVGCAQCHDHKYDPISQRDFYQLFAFFHGAMDTDIEAPMPGEMGPYMAARPGFDRKRAALLAEYNIPQLQAEWEPSIRRAMTDPGKDLEFDFSVTSMRAMFDHADRVVMTTPEKRSRRDAERLTNYFINNPGPRAAKDKELQEKFKELRTKLKELVDALPPLSEAAVIVDDPQADPCRIYIKGDYKSPGIEVPPGTLSVLPPLKVNGKPSRLDLARWLVSPENPLTPRVAVNRHWQEFFGRGLVNTSEDFGTQGEKPSHPELLDWLAAEFMDRGWSMKQLHRLIVTSATYRQSSKARPDIDSRDPENALLSHQRRLRLSAESIRDVALASSGLLNPAIGGRSVRPPLPAGVAELGYGNSVKWVESIGMDKYRRGLYVHFQRTTPHPQLMNFDAPDSNVFCSRRRRSNTPLQALNLLNDPVFFEAAQGLALRILTDAPPTARDRINYLYDLTLGRAPSSRESDRLLAYLDQQKTLLAADTKAAEGLLPFRPAGVDAIEGGAWTGVARVVMNLDEFITRE